MELQGELPVILTLSSEISIEYLKYYISVLLMSLKHKKKKIYFLFSICDTGIVFKNLKLWLSFSIDFYQQELASAQRPVQYLSGKMGRGSK